MKCPDCNGTGHMSNEQARDLYERDGTRPNQTFGCVECDGLGEIEDGEE